MEALSNNPSTGEPVARRRSSGEMKHLGTSRRSSMVDSRKVPLNNVILPPLSPTFPENGPQLIGKVTVNKSKSGNVNGEIVVARGPQDAVPKNGDAPLRGTDEARLAQLEQNIRFLQEQHQLMLAGLHNEIESLKNRNKDLQFQLVFAKGGTPSSSPSSPEDDAKHKVYQSPKSLNTTPLQVEILEKELGELKLQLQETESRNVYLSAIVDEQKKKLERYERDREKERERAGQPDPELLRKLDDAEAIIRRLRRENSDLRRENAYVPREGGLQHHGGSAGGGGGGGGGFPSRPGGQNSGGGRGRHHRGNYRGNWFPPLHSQSYWQGSRSSERSNLPVEGLPNLHGDGGHYQGRRGANNNHYQQQGEGGRKHRGGSKNNKQT